MISKAIGKYLRVSPRKTRLVAGVIRGRQVDEALDILNSTNKKSARLLVKVLNSAISNAKRFPNMQQENLYISKIFADGGPTLKRYRAEPMGRASVLRKKTSHITIELDMKVPKIQPKEAKATPKVVVRSKRAEKAKSSKEPKATKPAKVIKKKAQKEKK